MGLLEPEWRTADSPRERSGGRASDVVVPLQSASVKATEQRLIVHQRAEILNGRLFSSVLVSAYSVSTGSFDGGSFKNCESGYLEGIGENFRGL